MEAALTYFEVVCAKCGVELSLIAHSATEANQKLNEMHWDMTKEQAINKIMELLPDVEAYLVRRCDELLRSGGVDLEAFTDDFRLPKVVLTAALLDAGATCYMPSSPELHRLVHNLRNF